MNEKYIKLVDRASALFFSKNANLHPGSIQMPSEFLKMYSDLLVQECANLAKAKSDQIIDRGMKYAVDVDEEDAVKSTAWQFDVFGQEIKNHFGVEQ